MNKALFVLATIIAFPTFAAENSAVISVPKNLWIEQHHRQITSAKQIGCEIMFLGDSITQGWNGNGRKIWEDYFAKKKAVNFGIGGDRTQHVLWRLQNGALDGVTPKVVVLMIGTNNTDVNSAEQIIEGIKAILDEIVKRSPQSKILLLDIFPRGEKPNTDVRKKIAAVNAGITKFDNGKTILFFPIGYKFLQSDGSISKAIMPDFLHLTEEGYAILANAVNPKLDELLK